MNGHIHIVTLPGENFMPNYLICRLAELWREQGHQVTVGPAARLDADTGIMHVDRTVVPDQCLPDNPRGHPLLNGSILNISKRRISSNLVNMDSDYSGPVIIKTDANSSGWPERAARTNWIQRRFNYILRRAVSWRLSRELLSSNYPVVNNLSHVPGWVWKRSDLVVEKFMPEVDGEQFVLRVWVFFGDQEYGARMLSRNPVVKVRGATRYEYIDGVPETLRAVRRELAMDFGKFDYVMVGGEAVLLDVNKTPIVSRNTHLQRLASGLAAYMGRPA